MLIEELAQRYDQAWNHHDLDAICAMHTDDVVLRVGGSGGVTEVSGLDACRERFSYLLTAWPDLKMENRRSSARDGMCFVEFVFTGTLAEPWQLGNETFDPNGSRVSFAGFEVLEFEGNRIGRKTSLLDGIELREQLRT